MTDQEQRPLWKWVLLAIVPSLVSAAAAVFSWFSHWLDPKHDGYEGPMIVIQLLAPVIGFFYLIVLSGKYTKVEAYKDASRVMFVFGYGALNTVIWLAGCSLQMSGLNIH
jgi:phosphoglycerol transferase MdoB-like AlkP superfamily enzyme